MAPDPGAQFRFEEEWPSLSSRIRMMLARCGVAAALRDDLVQETGLRLLELKDAIDPSRSVHALAKTIALNLLRDHVRRERRLVSSIDLRRFEDPADVEREVIARDDWARVARAIARLSPERRAVLLAEVGAAATPSSESASATRMLRMRARKQLVALLEEMERGKAVCGITLQRTWESIVTRIGRAAVVGPREQIAHLGGAAIAVITASVLGIHSPSTTPSPPENKVPSRVHDAASLASSARSLVPTGYPPPGLRAANLRAADDETEKLLGEKPTRGTKPIRLLSGGALDYVEESEEEALDNLAKTVSDVKDAVDRDRHLRRVKKRGCALASIGCRSSSSAGAKARRSK